MNGLLWKGLPVNIFWIKEDITYLQWRLRKIYSSPKLFVKMKPNKLLVARIIISIHARRGAVKLKSARYQSFDDILLKRNYDSHLWPKCIQSYVTRYHDFHRTARLRMKDAMGLPSVTTKHPSKYGKLNRVGRIFPNLFDLHTHTLITTIFFMVNDVEASQSLQSNVLMKFGVPYCLFMK